MPRAAPPPPNKATHSTEPQINPPPDYAIALAGRQGDCVVVSEAVGLGLCGRLGVV